MLKKFTLMLIGLFLLISFLTPSFSVYATNVEEKSVTDLFSEDKQLLSEVVLNHLTTTINQDNKKELIVVDSETLDKELKAIGAPITGSEIESAVSKFNYYISVENGKGPITELANLPLPTGRALDCNTVMSAIGYIHGGSYAIAAALLGITGPAAVIVPVLIGAAYQLATLLC